MTRGMADDDYGLLLQDIIAKGLVSSILSITHSLGVLTYLADSGGPVTSLEIADARNLKERYVREAMNCLACAKVVDVSKNSSGEVTYHMTSAQGAEFRGPRAMMLGTLASQATRFAQMVEVFKREGPRGLGFADDPWAQGSLDHMMVHRVAVQVELTLASVAGVREKLETGISVVEFGSGSGAFIRAFAEKFPESSFLASEYTETTTRKLTDNLSDVSNMAVRRLDLLNPPDDLLESFDLVLVNDVIHDLPAPLTGLTSVRDVLRPGGQLALLDLDGHSDVTVARAGSGAATAAAMYAASTFHCVAAASQTPESVALGSCWGRDAAVRMIREAGLTLLSLHPHLDTFVLYVCQK